jgi:hypothetical protein
MHHTMMQDDAEDESSELPMNAITVRNLPPAVAKVVCETARREKPSLNKAVVKLPEGATGTEPRKKVLHRDLDHVAGTWSRKEYRDFMNALREQRQIDPEMWKSADSSRTRPVMLPSCGAIPSRRRLCRRRPSSF